MHVVAGAPVPTAHLVQPVVRSGAVLLRAAPAVMTTASLAPPASAPIGGGPEGGGAGAAVPAVPLSGEERGGETTAWTVVDLLEVVNTKP